MLKLEHLFFTASGQRSGINVIVWDDKQELVRCLIVVRALVSDHSITNVLVSTSDASIQKARELIEPRRSTESGDETFLTLFVQQASSSVVGPFLNGSRKPLADPPGSLIVVRAADLHDFIKAAPDLSSFVVFKIFNASEMLSSFDVQLVKRFSAELPDDLTLALIELPGEMPTAKEVQD